MVITDKHKLYTSHYGRLYKITGIFTTVKDANNHCEINCNDGVLVDKGNLIFTARLNDNGINHSFLHLSK